MADSTTEKWSSLDDIAEYLGVSKDSVYRWLNNKQMPAHKIGRLWKFKITEVDEWVKLGKAAEQRLNKVEKQIFELLTYEYIERGNLNEYWNY